MSTQPNLWKGKRLLGLALLSLGSFLLHHGSVMLRKGSDRFEYFFDPYFSFRTWPWGWDRFAELWWLWLFLPIAGASAVTGALRSRGRTRRMFLLLVTVILLAALRQGFRCMRDLEL